MPHESAMPSEMCLAYRARREKRARETIERKQHPRGQRAGCHLGYTLHCVMYVTLVQRVWLQNDTLVFDSWKYGKKYISKTEVLSLWRHGIIWQ